MAKKRAHRPAGYAAPSTPPTRPAPGPRAPQQARPTRPAPAPSSRRARFERRSAPWLLRLQLLPGFVIPVVLGLLLFLGLALPWAWAGVLLIVIGLFLLWLTAVSWPAISPGSRALRMVVNIGILALGVARLGGWM
jgi:VIT1/CCC1 family predicted Fe2+/Mn2+ transporter